MYKSDKSQIANSNGIVIVLKSLYNNYFITF